MNLYAIPPIITLALILIEGYFVYFNNKQAKPNRIYGFFCLSLCIWLFGFAGMYLNEDPHAALFWARNGFFGIIFIPIFAYHFVVSFLGIKRDRLLAFLYITSIPSLLVFRTNLVYKDVARHFWGYYPVAGKFYIFFLICFLVGFCGGVLRLIIALTKKDIELTSRKKNQIKYLMLAFGIGTTGVIDYAVKFPAIDIYPWGYISAFGLITFFALAIVKHQLLEIEVVIKKTLVFAGLSAFFLGIIVITSFIVQDVLGNVIGIPRIWTYLLSAFIVIALYEPVKNFLINATNKYLFQKKYSPTQLIKTFTNEVLTLLDLQKLARTTITTLADSLNLAACAIFLLNKDEDKYDLQDSYGLDDNNIILNIESGFVKYLSRMGDVLLAHQGMPEEIKNDMKKINTILALPLILHKQMIGILCLGKKKSDEDYTKEDIDILTTLAKAEAVALSNARLFSEAKQNVKLAAIGALAAGINHEVCNPLNRMMSDIQIFLKSKEMGLYKNKSDKEIAEMSDNIMKEAMDEIRRIANITRKLSDFAKPSKEVAAERVDILDSLKDTLSVLGHEMELKKIDFIQDAKEPLFIMADKDQLQEIFFNMLRNAIQAIEGKGKIIFSTHKKGENVVIDITDTGCGISEDRLQRIYNPFYTTKEDKGTGLGLAIVRQLVIKNKGNISVRSRVGEGTTFTLVFPEAI